MARGLAFVGTASGLRQEDFAAQTVRQRGRDPDVDEAADQSLLTGEVDHPVIVGAAGQLVAVLARMAFDQYALGAADHGLADGECLALDQLLQLGVPP